MVETLLSKNFTLAEMIASETARKKNIVNAPGSQELSNMCGLVHHVLQPLRDAMGEAVSISSGYRSVKLNDAVGGVKNSQHTKGEAADISIDGDLAKGRRWFEWIRWHCEYDQLIWEHNRAGVYWIHVSYRLDGKNRGQVINDLEKK